MYVNYSKTDVSVSVLVSVSVCDFSHCKDTKFFLTYKQKRKIFNAKVHFFCIIEKVRAMCVPYLKN